MSLDFIDAPFTLPVRPEELARVEMLSALPPAAIRELAEKARRCVFRAGQVVFNEGDEGGSLFVVRRGTLKVLRPTRDDRLVLDRLRPGRLFGELACSTRRRASPRSSRSRTARRSRSTRSDLDAVLDQPTRWPRAGCSARSPAR